MFARIFISLLTSALIVVSTYHNVFAVSGEICDNGTDDDGDGLIDLNDPDCECLTTPISHIPNPSFEEITCCPSGNSQLHCAGTWIQASEATTDYYHRCGYFMREQFPVPLPIPDGDAYIGFRNGYFSRDNSNNNPEYNPANNSGGSSGNNSGNNSDGSSGSPFGKSNPSWKEYTGACLLAPLEAGNQYTIEFYIGFVSQQISPPMNVVLYGTTDCDNLPFGLGNREFGCPTNGSGWQALGQVHVNGNRNWKQYKITTTPRSNITAIAIGPDCPVLDLDVNPYYFLDHLILADSKLFAPDIEEIGHPCQPDFSITASERKNASYQWYRDGIAISGAVERELKINGREGNYQVQMRLDSNCVLSEPYSYIVPVLENEIRIVVCPGETLVFGDLVLSQSGYYSHVFQSQYDCDSIVDLELVILEEKVDSAKEYFFEGETYQVGPYRFGSPGTANLTLTSSLGCDSLVHLTLEEYSLNVPNAFSPNGDGVNDYFTVYGREDFIVIRAMRIFDRWGNRVYEQKNDEPFRWDGTGSGGALDSGTYAYTLDLILHDGKRKMIQGDVTLLR
ncbi:gliding motility-associated C-terminal domain-containing protein [Membranicola marinus]|uniref:Gliding motility-associated C-terminal domain-containing protein n=1 Tax=Membranihabitans marinus TaxID=1227546 RepID=A0A953HW60_9BACT|nr:gliding motility-associated C-terminal domain-containing protein [Membranihabitans marinus]MBY5959600.1 gliding motility-associated C-terminal domain-containing protein [Membranihabitans marinus]